MKHLVLASALLIAAGSVSCTKSSNAENEVTRAHFSAVQEGGEADTKAAEMYAEFSEASFGKGDFKNALFFADFALARDPSNFRAQFHRASAKAMGVFKGLFVRVRPLTRITPSAERNHQIAMEKAIIDYAQPEGLLPFLNDGQEDLKTESDVQNYVDQFIDAVQELRLFFLKNRDKEITLKVNPIWVPNPLDRWAEGCQIIALENYEYEMTCPAKSTRDTVTVNRADFEMLASMLQLYAAYLAPLNGYDLTGVVAAEKKFEAAQTQHITPSLMWSELMQTPSFGTLRAKNRFATVKSGLIEVLSGFDWMIANYPTLCVKGSQSGANRPGMLLYQGVCMAPAFKPYLAKYKADLTAGVTDTTVSQGAESYTTKVNYGAFFERPLKDLRVLNMIFDNCGSVVQVSDPTFNGVYPNRDANKVLSLSNGKCSL